MKQEQFIYWLQGFAELQGTLPTESQWEDIKIKLKMVTSSLGSLATLQNKGKFVASDHYKVLY